MSVETLNRHVVRTVGDDAIRFDKSAVGPVAGRLLHGEVPASEGSRERVLHGSRETTMKVASHPSEESTRFLAPTGCVGPELPNVSTCASIPRLAMRQMIWPSRGCSTPHCP